MKAMLSKLCGMTLKYRSSVPCIQGGDGMKMIFLTNKRDTINLTNEQCYEPPTGMVGKPYGWSLGPTGLNLALVRWRSLRAQTRLMKGPFGPTAAPTGGPVVYLW